jgi:hypothetical protein
MDHDDHMLVVSILYKNACYVHMIILASRVKTIRFLFFTETCFLQMILDLLFCQVSMENCVIFYNCMKVHQGNN